MGAETVLTDRKNIKTEPGIHCGPGSVLHVQSEM
nr:MAG TPA: hypothetical protein [Caudoviricetes sp.]